MPSPLNDSSLKMKYGYSLDDESFTGSYDSVEDAINEAIDSSEFNITPGDVYICDCRYHSYFSILNLDILLEDAENALIDYCGEAAEGYLDKVSANPAARDELRHLIADWLEARVPMRVYEPVNSRKAVT